MERFKLSFSINTGVPDAEIATKILISFDATEESAPAEATKYLEPYGDVLRQGTDIELDTTSTRHREFMRAEAEMPIKWVKVRD